MGEALDSFMVATGLQGQLGETRALRAWKQAAGTLARRAQAVRFQKGVLTVEVSSAAHLQELQSFSGEPVRRKANALLSGNPIDRVVYKLKS